MTDHWCISWILAAFLKASALWVGVNFKFLTTLTRCLGPWNTVLLDIPFFPIIVILATLLIAYFPFLSFWWDLPTLFSRVTPRALVLHMPEDFFLWMPERLVGSSENFALIWRAFMRKALFPLVACHNTSLDKEAI